MPRLAAEFKGRFSGIRGLAEPSAASNWSA